MTHVVVLGAGLAGVLQAYELKAELRPGDTLTVISKGPRFQFLPSNPWVAVKWRTQDSVEVDLPPIMARRGIEFIPVAARRVRPEDNAIELEDGRTIKYDYLVIATGPELAFDEVEGLGPEHCTQSICQTGHAAQAGDAWERFVQSPGPLVVGAAQGVSCFGPGYEYAFIAETDLRKRRIRDKVPITYITSEPYIGHLGLDGVGDTKTLLESAMRERHIKWITNARIRKIEPGKITAEELDESGNLKSTHELPFAYSMIMPPFRGVAAIRGIEGLVNPRGFVIVDKFQRNPTFKNVYSAGVTVAIAPVGKTPVPVGVPKTGFMIESMVTAIAKNIGLELRGMEPENEPTWNAVCLADFGDEGVAFVAQPQIPPRNLNWSSKGKWVHKAKIGFEKYFLGKIRRGESEPFYERLVLDVLGIRKLKEIHKPS
jgi:sulfide:quinone oxidoreductase